MNNEIKELKRSVEKIDRDIELFEEYIAENNLDRQDLRNLLTGIRGDFNVFKEAMKDSLDGFVSKERYSLIEKIVFGAVTIILVGVMTGIVTLVINKP